MCARAHGRALVHRALIAGLAVCVCAGCSTREPVSLPFQTAPAFSDSGVQGPPDLWWTVFEDRGLNAHIAQALEENFTLASAWHRLRAARALARRQAADLYPELDLGASARRQELDDAGRRDTFTVGPQAAYEVDLWGRIRSATEAERLRARASEADYRTAALTLSADIALSWYRLVEADNQINLLKRQIATNEKVLEVLKVRFGAGRVRSEDILRQRLLIEALWNDVITLESQIAVLEHQLAVLRGEAPQGRDFQVAEGLPGLPPRPAAGVPAHLVQRRPDVRAAYYRLQAADQDLAAAIRDQYPSLNLSASYVSEAATASNLFSTWLTGFGATLLAPVFDGGRRQAEIERSEAVRTQRVNEYGQTVLVAFRDVEDALIRENKQRERINNFQARLGLAEDAYEQLRIGYFNGVNDYLAVLSALDELQQLERDLLLARRNLIEFRIALYRALAGGFDTPRDARPGDSRQPEEPDS